jgi:tRNA/tmRNA/rRNA uracil-C5-methylase (TrmA/RlmC/RlmD family)
MILTVDRLVAGGDGFLRMRDGRACFVPGGLPGDRIRPTRQTDRKGMVRVTSFELLTPSEHRVEPPCAVAGRCGGCDWMGLERSEQLVWKGRVLQECLQRQGRVEVDVGPARSAGPALGYRHRVRLQSAGGQLGFFARGSRDLVPIDRCEVAHPSINDALAAGCDAVELRVGVDGAGPDVVQRIDLPGAWIDVPPRAFSQINPHVNRALVQRVLDGVGDAKTAFDLHCGAGNFALPLAAAGLAVRGCDVAGPAIQAARRSARAQGLDVELFGGSALDALARWTDRPDLVVLDPPRAGCREIIAPLLERMPTHIAMISCDPATCARDVGALVRGGYVVRSAEAWDMFPQTHHVEALVWLDAT